MRDNVVITNEFAYFDVSDFQKPSILMEIRRVLVKNTFREVLCESFQVWRSRVLDSISFLVRDNVVITN